MEIDTKMNQDVNSVLTERCDLSARSLRSQASSTKTHRRICVEVGSMFFSSAPDVTDDEHSLARSSSKAFFENEYQNSNARNQSSDSRLECILCPPETSAPPPDLTTTATYCLPSYETYREGSNRGQVQVIGDAWNKSSSNQKDQIDHLDPASRAVEFMRQLSFDTPVPQQTSISDRTVSDNILSPTQSTPQSNDDCISARVDAAEERPPSPPQIPLPPKINRLGDHCFHAIPKQIVHNRNRARSASLSEMSDSCRADLFDSDDASLGSSSSSPLTTSSSNNEISDELIAVQNDVTLSNDDSFTPEDIPFADPACVLCTIPSEIPSSVATQKPLSLKQCIMDRSPTMTSDHSSFVSSASSSQGGIPGDASVETTQHLIGDCDDEFSGFDQPLYYDDIHTGDIAFSKNEVREDAENQATRPRLNSETLRKWNEQCEEEAMENGITKDQHIWRALSYPDDIKDLGEMKLEPIESVEEPHLMAKRTMSQSLWSYTNSGPPSTITSANSTVELDFDFSFSHSLEVSQDTEVDELAQHVSGHKRIRSFGTSKFVLPPMKSTAYVKNRGRHRRHKSDGCFSNTRQKYGRKKLDAATIISGDLDGLDHRRGKSLDFQQHHLLQSIHEAESKAEDDFSAKPEDSFSTSFQIIDEHTLVMGIADKVRQNQWFGLGLGFVMGTIFGLTLPVLFRAPLLV
mmetsp:Transcript_26334/g.53406  ORF Transcript_26334/g.53406 Transcript_26334/m.53406 type:complete len:689 (-) Transcript_26334:102-2168(-)